MRSKKVMGLVIASTLVFVGCGTETTEKEIIETTEEVIEETTEEVNEETAGEEAAEEESEEAVTEEEIKEEEIPAGEGVTEDKGEEAVIGEEAIEDKVEDEIVTEESVEDTEKEEATEGVEAFTGLHTVQIPRTLDGDDMVVVTVEFEAGTPIDLVIDVRQFDGTMKNQASIDGEYVEVEGLPIHEQHDKLEAYIIANNFDLSTIILDETGRTNSVSGVSVYVRSYLEAVQQAINDMK